MTTQFAPAKVNLALDILRRRPDGYHDMHMVMQTVSLCDEVSFSETAGGFAIRTEGISIPGGKKTMEQQTAEAFFHALGRPMPGLLVELKKQIPAYAGLGGGSSDVAALLRLLRAKYAPQMPTYILEAIGFEVGSDIPFCLRGGTVLAQGRGEVLTDLPPLPNCWFVLCKPEFDLPTPKMFARVTPGAWEDVPDINGMISALATGDLVGVARRMSNVFEEVLPPQARVEVENIKDVLFRCGALGASMSGSGSAVAGIFRTSEETDRPIRILKRRYKNAFLAKPVPKLYNTN